MEKQYSVVVVGATGAVGTQMMEQLEKRKFPIGNIKFLASKRSAGQTISFQNETYVIEEATPEQFAEVDFALFSAGGSVSKMLAKDAVKHGAIVIDNTSAFRMDTEVPLVVPEVNKDALKNHNGIIANPNCSTIQMVCVLQPLHEKFTLKKVVVSTYQAVSGSGAVAIQELVQQSKKIDEREHVQPEILPVKSESIHYPIVSNVIPQIDVFTENGFTYEEMKMINETKKIMSLPDLDIAATCVRVPVITGHSESVYMEFETEINLNEVRQLLTKSDGVTVVDDITKQLYPMPSTAERKDDVFVGRIRRDLTNPNGLHVWIVSDNLLKGAALNSIQIAEAMIQQGLK